MMGATARAAAGAAPPSTAGEEATLLAAHAQVARHGRREPRVDVVVLVREQAVVRGDGLGQALLGVQGRLEGAALPLERRDNVGLQAEQLALARADADADVGRR